MVFVPDWDERRELPTVQLALLPGLTPSGKISERGGNSLDTYTVDLFVAKRLQDRTAAELRGLLLLLDEFTGFILPRNNSDFPLAILDDNNNTWTCTGWEFQRRYDPNTISREKHGDTVTYTGAFYSIVSTSWRRVT
ncbi:MAG: hypothetical protein R3B90_21735 [Planctomycetaceae bacterium]